MKATELRIGNLVKRSRHSNWQERHWGEEIEVGYNEMYLCSLQETTDWYEPIPLTEKWLLKFGFKHIKTNNCIYWFLNNVDVWELNGGFANDLDLPIQHVHQLQNLYYALTNKELTI